ncbi:initiator tRNA phosphoribosyl transferase [Ceraceosorus guamensis]|uniref:Initiator tRNA phosphoribosyl transferase n=1 Tax=Ceraceosorus guamensis TaxID=1522189 RepID=A0A316VYZ2_9BASI|nr:initiator tRNA phosphoribosyl transferase [Ceraceosorus guamensis]PWN41471.1 initiator tRNA phosphoribosyl transferase [Ceraceosorus guamensis]
MHGQSRIMQEETPPRILDARKQHRSVERDVRNRLHSILLDIRFTQQLHSLHFSHLPLIPNLRCGAWYVSPHLSRCCCCCCCCVPPTYFKSTDGHLNTWDFSLKRPNLAFLKLTLEKGGAVCVDSTRRGKILPDALSKTLPIWCAVLNEASFRRHGVPRMELQRQTTSHHSQEQQRAERHPLASLRTYLSAVSPQEHADIESRLHDWAEKLLSSAIQVARLEAPLVPFFITPSTLGEAAQESVETDEFSSLTSELEAFRRATKDHNIVPVICVSASLHANAPGQESHLPRTRKRKKSGVGVGDDDDESHLVAAETETHVPRPVVLPSSASSTVTMSAESEASETFTYVQGSGDDEESWSLGLTPSVFWKDPERILEEVDEIYATCADQTARNVACRQAFARLKDEEEEEEELEEHAARVDRSEERSARPVEIPASGIWIGEDAPEQTMNFARFALILHTSRSASSAETFGDGTDRAEPSLGSAPSARRRQVNLGWKAGKKGVGAFAHGLMSAVVSCSVHAAPPCRINSCARFAVPCSTSSDSDRCTRCKGGSDKRDLFRAARHADHWKSRIFSSCSIGDRRHAGRTRRSAASST